MKRAFGNEIGEVSLVILKSNDVVYLRVITSLSSGICRILFVVSCGEFNFLGTTPF
jgi:hypothetical protein